LELLDAPIKNNKRHAAKNRFLKETFKTTFKLTNKPWAYNSCRLG
jgi:hypothetical protein